MVQFFGTRRTKSDSEDKKEEGGQKRTGKTEEQGGQNEQKGREIREQKKMEHT